MASRKRRNTATKTVNINGKIVKRKKRKRNRALHYMLLLFLVVATIVALSLTVFFKINEVLVEGNDYYSNQDIIDAANIEMDKNLFLTSIKNIPEEIEKQFPYIEEVTVKRSLPSTIRIITIPGEISAALQLSEEEYVLISKTGKILERGLFLIPSDVILVKGFDIGEKNIGDHLGEYEKETKLDEDSESVAEMKALKNTQMEEQAEKETELLRVIEYMIDATGDTGFTKITNLDVTDPLNMKSMYENRILIEWGTEISLEYKFRYIKDALAELPVDARGTLSVENITIDTQGIFIPAEDYFIDEPPDDGNIEEDTLSSDGEAGEITETT